MASRIEKKLDMPTTAPLYRDIFEFIDVMGIKQNRVIEAFGVGRSNWYKLKHQHLNGISLENMHSFATYFSLPPEKVMALCYMTYTRGMAKQQSDQSSPAQPVAETASMDVDSDFPPIH
jgi:predicted XRE-type DNA-binding protein